MIDPLVFARHHRDLLASRIANKASTKAGLAMPLSAKTATDYPRTRQQNSCIGWFFGGAERAWRLSLRVRTLPGDSSPRRVVFAVTTTMMLMRVLRLIRLFFSSRYLTPRKMKTQSMARYSGVIRSISSARIVRRGLV